MIGEKIQIKNLATLLLFVHLKSFWKNTFDTCNK